jgi:hypothetical protein
MRFSVARTIEEDGDEQLEGGRINAVTIREVKDFDNVGPIDFWSLEIFVNDDNQRKQAREMYKAAQGSNESPNVAQSSSFQS